MASRGEDSDFVPASGAASATGLWAGCFGFLMGDRADECDRITFGRAGGGVVNRAILNALHAAKRETRSAWIPSTGLFLEDLAYASRGSPATSSAPYPEMDLPASDEHRLRPLPKILLASCLRFSWHYPSNLFFRTYLSGTRFLQSPKSLDRHGGNVHFPVLGNE
jgi:hypothetical protein